MQLCNVIVGGLVLATLLHISVLSKPTQEITDDDFVTSGMIYLGTVDGKSFFYETYPERTWFEAKDACNASNMHLASITSVDQARFLDTVTNMENYTGKWFWTAGRDSQIESQFMWDAENLTASREGLTFVAYETVLTCLAFVPRLTQIGYLRSFPCTDLRGSLCQVHHSQ